MMAVVEARRIQVHARPDGVPLGTQPINALRWVLAEADRLYFEQVAAAVLETGSLEVAYTVPYPDLYLDRALTGLAAEGWEAGTEEIVTLLGKFGRRLFTFAADPRDEALDLLAAGQRVVPPTDNINRYVATRIPPLKYQVETHRRELCRDIVSDSAREGLGHRGAMDRLQEEGFGRSAWHRETIARTEAGTLHNWGRFARYHSSGACSGVRFDAVMDNRTTPTCEYQDGREFQLRGGAGGSGTGGAGTGGAPAVPEWKPTMTAAEADAWAKDSVIPGDLYHGTDLAAAEAIKNSGFRPSEGGFFGPGIYTSEDFEVAKRYQKFGPLSEKGGVLKLRVNAKKIWRGTEDEWFGSFRDELVGPALPMQIGVTREDLAIAKMRGLGYDGLSVTTVDGDYTMIWDKKSVVVVDG